MIDGEGQEGETLEKEEAVKNGLHFMHERAQQQTVQGNIQEVRSA